MNRKLIVVHDNTRLPELGNIFGPILTPTRVTLDGIRAMLVKNRAVYECDPADPRNAEKRIALTLSNYASENFTKTSGQTSAVVETKKDSAPVAEKNEAVKKVDTVKDIPATDSVKETSDTEHRDDSAESVEEKAAEDSNNQQAKTGKNGKHNKK